jgi:hypothetical protein
MDARATGDSANNWLKGGEKLTAELERAGLFGPVPEQLATPFTDRHGRRFSTFDQDPRVVALLRRKLLLAERVHTDVPPSGPARQSSEETTGLEPAANEQLPSPPAFFESATMVSRPRTRQAGAANMSHKESLGFLQQQVRIHDQKERRKVREQPEIPLAPIMTKDHHPLDTSTQPITQAIAVPGSVANVPDAPVVVGRKRGRSEEDSDDGDDDGWTSRASQPHFLDVFHHIQVSPKRPRTSIPLPPLPPPPPAAHLTEAGARKMLQGLTKKTKEVNTLNEKITDAVRILNATNAKAQQSKKKLEALRRHRKVLERVYMAHLKSDARLRDGSGSWRPQQEGEPAGDRADVQDVSDEPHTSDFVETEDDRTEETAQGLAGLSL